MIRVLSLLVISMLSMNAANGAGPVDNRMTIGGGLATPVQVSDAERAWEAIKNTNSPAVLNSFIARYPGTKFAELARQRLERVKPTQQPAPVSSLDAAATAEDILAELPMDREILRSVEASGFFRADVPVLVRKYALATSRTEVYGGYRTVMSADEQTSVRAVRGSLIRLDQVEDDTTVQANVTTKYKRQNLEILAGAGFLPLASKTRAAGKPATEQRTTLVRLQSVQGRMFPLERGNQFSFEAIYKQEDITAPEQFTQKRSCQVVDEMEAARFHTDLSGRAYVASCRYDTAYKRSKRYTGKLGIHSGNHKMVFITQFGIWLYVSADFTLKTFELGP